MACFVLFFLAWTGALAFVGSSIDPGGPAHSRPLSYVLADTDFLAEELGAIRYEGVDWSSRVSEYLSHVERTVGGIGTLTPMDGPQESENEEKREESSGQRSRRDLPTDPLTTLTKDPHGVFLLKALVPRFNIPAKFPNDVVVFSRQENGLSVWYAAALEADGMNPQTSLANWLVLYKLVNKRFVEQTRVATYGASSLAVEVIDGWTYLVASERTAWHRDAPQKGSILYRLSPKSASLVPTETLLAPNPSDLCFWEFGGAHYLAVASEFTNTTDSLSHSADTLVYKWFGEHLDIVQRLPTTGARAVTAFTIESNQYIVVANHINDQEETNIDSVVYRFDTVKQLFVVHQHLRTHAAVDVSFFSMRRSRGSDHFLVVANNYYQGPDLRKNYETNSVIYKWTEGYFVPFQSFSLVAASQWTPYLGPRGEVVLLAVSSYGLHAFQYNGWRFEQLLITGGPLLVGSKMNIASLRSLVLDSEGVLVIANKENAGTETNVFSLQFEQTTPLEKLYAELRYWCENQLGKLRSNSVDNLLQRVEATPKWNSPLVEVDTVHFESNSKINTLSAYSFKMDKHVVDADFVKSVNKLATDLEDRKKDLAQAQAIIDSALKRDGSNVVKGRVVMHNATVQCGDSCLFNYANVIRLNTEDAVEFVRNVVPLDTNISGKSLRFSDLVVPGDVVSSRVLGEDAELVNRVETKHLLGDLVVDELIVRSGLQVGGTIDDTRITDTTVLLVDGDQTLSGFTSTSHWQVNKLILNGRVNGMTLDMSRPVLPPEVPPSLPNAHPQTLQAINLRLGGLLGGVDIGDVAKRALRTNGNQVVTGAHSFAKLSVTKGVNTSPLGGTRFEDIIRTDSEKSVIPGKLLFSQPLHADQVQVYKRLNHMNVAPDGSLDLLLRGGLPGTQRVVGPKWVRRLSVTDEARVHGRILGLYLPPEDEELVRIIEDRVEVDGDVTITGNVDVGGTLVAQDILDAGSGVSVLNVVKHAVPLDAPLPPSVVIEDLEVMNVDVRLVNGVPTDSWILDAPGAEVRVSKPVTFFGDVVVSGTSVLNGKVNNVDLKALSQTALKTTGNQIIHGHKTFDHVSAHAVWSNDTMLGGARWQDVWAHRGLRDPQRPRPTKGGILRLDETVVVDGQVTTKRLKLDGTLGGLDLDKTLKDTVFSDDKGVVVIDGPKSFAQTVTVDNLHVGAGVQGSDLERILTATIPVPPQPDDELHVEQNSINIQNPLYVGRLAFQGTLDGLSDVEWSSPWLEVDGDQTLEGSQVILGNVDAMSGVEVSQTNNIDLSSFAQDVVRIDDPNLRLGTVTFTGTVVANGNVAAGLVGGVSLSDALLSRGELAQEVSGRLTLSGGVEVMGALKLEGTLAGENFKALCAFANPSPVTLNAPQHLTVQGDLHLVQEPLLKQTVNGQSMQKLISNTWLKDRAASINAEMDFSDVQFFEAVTVQDRIDGVSLDAISSRYVSLSRDETISTTLNVAKGIVVKGQVVSSGPIDVKGTVGTLRLNELADKVLMDGPDQDVPARMAFGIVQTTGDLQLDGTINGLDLTRDVVLIRDPLKRALDHNVVTERKVVTGSVRVGSLGLHEGVRVQDVDVAAWIQDAVLTTGDHIITGSKNLNTPQVAGYFTVDGLVAGVKVDADHLLLSNRDQVVLGAKTLLPSPLQGLGLRVQALSVEGLVNDVNMRELLANQAYRTGDVAVVTPVHMAASLHGTSVWLDSLYQGVNMTEIIYAAQHPPGLDLYAEHHNELLRLAEYVQRSLKSQGYYLNYYHTSVHLRTGIRAILPLGKAASTLGDIEDPAYAIAVAKYDPLRGLALHFFSWDALRGTIVPHPILSAVSLPRTTRMIEPAHFAGQNAIYWEGEERTGVHVGHLLGVRRDGRLGLAQVLRDTHPSAWATVTKVDDMDCLIRGSPDSFAALHCLDNGEDVLVRLAIPVSWPMHGIAFSVHGVSFVAVASGACEESDGSVSIWRWEANSAGGSLHLFQTLGVVNASALASVEYRGILYLAAASGHVEDAPHKGLVHISRYDSALGNWTHWMSLEVEGPRVLEFAELPSGELVLYVSTWCPTDSLVVFLYRGVAGFVRRASAAVPVGGSMKAFTTAQHQHVVAVGGGQERSAGQAALLQANFKGSWEASDQAFTLRSNVAQFRG